MANYAKNIQEHGLFKHHEAAARAWQPSLDSSVEPYLRATRPSQQRMTQLHQVVKEMLWALALTNLPRQVVHLHQSVSVSVEAIKALSANQLLMALTL